MENNRDTKRAFFWITGILENNKIPFKLTGGFAARIHGVKRELYDIDIDVADDGIDKIFREVEEYVIFGPKRYRDENFDLILMTLNYMGQEIDIAGANALIFNQNIKQWEKVYSNPQDAKIMAIFDKNVPVETIENLIEYKTKLGRDVDLEDIKQLRNKNGK